MSKTQVILNREEVFKAIFEYIMNHYPFEPDEATISIERNKIKNVTVDCIIK